MKLTSSAFKDHGNIPSEYTCQGKNVSPPLSWTSPPEGTKSLALIVDDPDAPDPKAPKMTWVHWVLYDLPSASRSLPRAAHDLPPGTKQGLNDWHKPEYGGPCPPVGRHRYFFKLYALDTSLPKLVHPTKQQLLDAMDGHILARAQLIGSYEKR